MMSRIAESLKLPFPSYESVMNSTDKYLMKKCFEKNGVACAKGVLVNENFNNVELKNIIKQFDYPVIVKPVDNSGSRGVITCKNIEEIESALITAFKFSKLKRALIEEYIKGKEYSVESICFKNKINIIQVTEKITSKLPYNVEMGHLQPAELDEKERLLIQDIVIKCINSLKLDNCACHTEVKLNNKGPFIIENGPRLGGDFITSDLTPLSTSVNMEDVIIKIAIGKDFKIDKKNNGYSAIEYLHLNEGYVNNIFNWDSIFNIPGIVKAQISLIKNQKINKISNSLERYGYIIAKGKKRNEVINTINEGILYLKSKIEMKSYG